MQLLTSHTKARNNFFSKTTELNKLTMEKIKTTNKASISNTEEKSTEIGLKETESNKTLPAVGSVIDHSVVVFKF